MSMLLLNSANHSENFIYNFIIKSSFYKDFCIFRSAELAVPVMRRYYVGHDILVDFVFGSLRKRFQRDENAYRLLLINSLQKSPTDSFVSRFCKSLD